jgi:hypothetical protein
VAQEENLSRYGGFDFNQMTEQADILYRHSSTGQDAGHNWSEHEALSFWGGSAFSAFFLCISKYFLWMT